MFRLSSRISCEACGFSFKHQDSTRMHRHHIRPKEHGGDDGAANRVILCPNCHSIAHILLRNALTLSEYSPEYDIYRLYQRNHLIAEIEKYRGVESFWTRVLLKIRIPVLRRKDGFTTRQVRRLWAG